MRGVDSRVNHPKFKTKKWCDGITLVTYKRWDQSGHNSRWLDRREAADKGWHNPVHSWLPMRRYLSLKPALEVLPHTLPKKPFQRSWSAWQSPPDPYQPLHTAPPAYELMSWDQNPSRHWQGHPRLPLLTVWHFHFTSKPQGIYNHHPIETNKKIFRLQ